MRKKRPERITDRYSKATVARVLKEFHVFHKEGGPYPVAVNRTICDRLPPSIHKKINGKEGVDRIRDFATYTNRAMVKEKRLPALSGWEKDKKFMRLLKVPTFFPNGKRIQKVTQPQPATVSVCPAPLVDIKITRTNGRIIIDTTGEIAFRMLKIVQEEP